VASNITTVNYIFKRKYTNNRVEELSLRDHPTWYRIRKRGGFTGTDDTVPAQISYPQGIAGTLTAAQAAVESSKGVQFRYYRKKKYAVIRLDGEAMEACANEGAFVSLVTRETDWKLKEFGANQAFDLFGVGNGLRGQRAALAGDVITLTSTYDVAKFKVGMTLMASVNADGSAPKAGTCKVVSTDPDNSQITVDDITGIAGHANNDYLFRSGDPGTCMEGMGVCTPITAPVYGVDDFRDVDRGQAVRELAGTRQPSSGVVEDDLGLGAVKVSTLYRKLTEAAVHPLQFWKIVKRGDAKVQYDNAGGKLQIGFEYIMLQTPAGNIKVYSEPDIDYAEARAWDANAHYIHHLNEVTHIIRTNGNPHMQMASEDSIEIRGRSMLNYVQTDTASHLVVSGLT
jgi:hypothetical protein